MKKILNQVSAPATVEKRSPEGMFAAMCRHPYLLAIVLCGLLLPFGLGERATITPQNCVYLGVVLTQQFFIIVWLKRSFCSCSSAASRWLASRYV